MDTPLLIESLRKYLEEREKLSKLDGWIGKSTSSDTIMPAYIALRGIKSCFQQLVNEKKLSWFIQASVGQGTATPDHYIAILPQGQKVSNGIYYCICFDREGAGCVIGAMQSLLMPQHISVPSISRAKQITQTSPKRITWELISPNKINVWSRNNAFFNPMEILRDDLLSLVIGDKILDHFDSSKQIITELNGKKKNFF